MDTNNNINGSTSDNNNENLPPLRRPRTREDFYFFCKTILEYENYEASSTHHPVENKTENQTSPQTIQTTTTTAPAPLIESSTNNNITVTVINTGERKISKNKSVNSTDETAEAESYNVVTCYCGKPYAKRPMIECSNCLTWLHLTCAKVKRNKIPEVFYCYKCKQLMNNIIHNNDDFEVEDFFEEDDDVDGGSGGGVIVALVNEVSSDVGRVNDVVDVIPPVSDGVVDVIPPVSGDAVDVMIPVAANIEQGENLIDPINTNDVNVDVNIEIKQEMDIDPINTNDNNYDVNIQIKEEFDIDNIKTNDDNVDDVNIEIKQESDINGVNNDDDDDRSILDPNNMVNEVVIEYKLADYDDDISNVTENIAVDDDTKPIDQMTEEVVETNNQQERDNVIQFNITKTDNNNDINKVDNEIERMINNNYNNNHHINKKQGRNNNKKKSTTPKTDKKPPQSKTAIKAAMAAIAVAGAAAAKDKDSETMKLRKRLSRLPALTLSSSKRPAPLPTLSSSKRSGPLPSLSSKRPGPSTLSSSKRPTPLVSSSSMIPSASLVSSSSMIPSAPMVSPSLIPLAPIVSSYLPTRSPIKFPSMLPLSPIRSPSLIPLAPLVSTSMASTLRRYQSQRFPYYYNLIKKDYTKEKTSRDINGDNSRDTSDDTRRDISGYKSRDTSDDTRRDIRRDTSGDTKRDTSPTIKPITFVSPDSSSIKIIRSSMNFDEQRKIASKKRKFTSARNIQCLTHESLPRYLLSNPNTMRTSTITSTTTTSAATASTTTSPPTTTSSSSSSTHNNRKRANL